MNARHWLGIIIGAALLAAVAHVNISQTGGYGTPHAALTVAITVAVGAGAIFCGMAWRSDRRFLALAFGVCICAGEAFGLYQTANRLVSSAEQQQAPLREYAKTYKAAGEAVTAATEALEKAKTSRRLAEAIKAKHAADQAIADSAKEMGCRAVCAALLQKAADSAVVEVDNARKEADQKLAEAAEILRTAKNRKDNMRPPESPTPLADRLGWAGWLLDLCGAVLGSIGANGLACCLLVFGAHGEQTLTNEARAQVAPTKRKGAPRKNRHAPTEHAAQFAVERLARTEDGAAELGAILDCYREWAAGKPLRLSDAEIASELAGLFKRAGLKTRRRGSRIAIAGVSLKPDVLELAPPAHCFTTNNDGQTNGPAGPQPM